MIDIYELTELLKKYGMDVSIVINKNDNILTYGEYSDIDKTLNYLINELKILPKNIEKCPSIMYKNVSAIKSNVEFIKATNIEFDNIETCLHVLSAEPEQLKETYSYVKDNYGIEIINKITSILSVPVDRIKEIENLQIPFIDRNANLSVANGNNTIDEIKDIINSIEFQKYRDLFTPSVLVNSNIKDVQEMIYSEEFAKYPHLFTSEVLARSNIKTVQEMIHSEEFKEYPDLFSASVLARSNIKTVQEMIHSEEFKEYPDLFSASVLARSNIEDIITLLSLPYWEKEKYKKLLCASILVNSKSMIKKLPKLIELAEKYNISEFLYPNFILKSPSQDYAIIRYLMDNNLPLVQNNKLNPMFAYQPGVLKKKYKIDLKELMKKYPYEEEQVTNENEGKIIK